jgi:hypothetical protein
MAALGTTVQPRKDACQALAAQLLTQAEMVRHTDLTKRAMLGLVQVPIPGPMAPRGFGSRGWNSWRSGQPSYPCCASTWCALAGVWHRTVICVGRSSPRQQGVEDGETDTGSPRWSWARLLKRVFVLARARCPWCQRGVLRIIAALTHGAVIRIAASGWEGMAVLRQRVVRPYAGSRLTLYGRARCPILWPSFSPSNSPAAASPRVPEG